MILSVLSLCLRSISVLIRMGIFVFSGTVVWCFSTPGVLCSLCYILCKSPQASTEFDIFEGSSLSCMLVSDFSEVLIIISFYGLPSEG